MTRGKKINPGKAIVLRPTLTELRRFIAEDKIEEKQVLPLNHEIKGPCWLWKAHKDKAGYGQVKFRGKARWAHRLFREFFFNDVTDGLDVDHKCKVPGCVNPWHSKGETTAVNRATRTRVAPPQCTK